MSNVSLYFRLSSNNKKFEASVPRSVRIVVIALRFLVFLFKFVETMDTRVRVSTYDEIEARKRHKRDGKNERLAEKVNEKGKKVEEKKTTTRRWTTTKPTVDEEEGGAARLRDEGCTA